MSIAVAPQFRMPDELWDRIQPLLPAEKPLRTNGRPVVPFRDVMDGIFYVLRTGCHWKAVPAAFGSGSTVHARFQEWVQAGVFERLWREVLHEYVGMLSKLTAKFLGQDELLSAPK
jgi:putative transposase